MKKIFFTFLLVINPLAFAQSPEEANLSSIINSKHRSNDHRAKDQYRHPAQTLEFFEVKNYQTVVQITPNETWYAEILAPYLKDKGQLYSISKANFNEVTALAPDNSADRVLSFHAVHQWMQADQAASVFNAIYKALKPGGILGVVEHRNLALKPQDTRASSGYVSEDYMIELARKAGFEFLAKSEINANEKDTKDYPAGVWTLPPTLKLKDKDRQKYLAIGESDAMTIKFVKPAKTALLDIIHF